MTKQIVEITEERADGDGLFTKLFFVGGLSTEEGRFIQIDVSTIRVSSPEKSYYETVALGREPEKGENREIYQRRVSQRELISSSHLGMIETLKRDYLRS